MENKEEDKYRVFDDDEGNQMERSMGFTWKEGRDGTSPEEKKTFPTGGEMLRKKGSKNDKVGVMNTKEDPEEEKERKKSKG